MSVVCVMVIIHTCTDECGVVIGTNSCLDECGIPNGSGYDCGDEVMNILNYGVNVIKLKQRQHYI